MEEARITHFVNTIRHAKWPRIVSFRNLSSLASRGAVMKISTKFYAAC